MGLLDKAKAAAEQAATRAREGVEDVQAKRELHQAYHDLGRAAFGLVESGEVSHAELEPAILRVRALTEKLPPGDAAAEPLEPSGPPAMPT